MPDGVTGNTSDSGSEESRFEPLSGNQIGFASNYRGIFVFTSKFVPFGIISFINRF